MLPRLLPHLEHRPREDPHPAALAGTLPPDPARPARAASLALLPPGGIGDKPGEKTLPGSPVKRDARSSALAAQSRNLNASTDASRSATAAAFIEQRARSPRYCARPHSHNHQAPAQMSSGAAPKTLVDRRPRAASGNTAAVRVEFDQALGHPRAEDPRIELSPRQVERTSDVRELTELDVEHRRRSAG